jgi:2-polyprenyl-6-methoxyphenol hydroxylase-like FAD-dependent oxidoreductase
MDKNSRILISGAGIAGLTCAIWLGRKGFRPVVIEKSPTIRADGYIISLSHASYRYARELGLLEKIVAKDSGIRESSYHDRRGKTMLTLDYSGLFSGIDVVQIMRDDLQGILHEAAAEFADIRLATSIAEITQDNDEVQVIFNDGRREIFDLVIGADGLHSNTRTLAFAEKIMTKHYLGLFSSAYRLPNTLGMQQRFENHMERSRYMCVYTTRDDDLACVFIWQSDEKIAPSATERYATLKSSYADAPVVVQRVLESFPQDRDVYMDPLMQIEMRHWRQGNVVLTGDAAHCLTLLSGQGASSAFWGACTLAQALVSYPKAEAMDAYENSFRPTIDKIQPATRLAAKWYVPRTQLRYMLRDSAMRYLPDSYFQRYFKSKYSKA